MSLKLLIYENLFLCIFHNNVLQDWNHRDTYYDQCRFSFTSVRQLPTDEWFTDAWLSKQKNPERNVFKVPWRRPFQTAVHLVHVLCCWRDQLLQYTCEMYAFDLTSWMFSSFISMLACTVEIVCPTPSERYTSSVWGSAHELLWCITPTWCAVNTQG